jgi:hypothetical protein
MQVMIEKLPKYMMRLLMVLVIIVLFVKIIIPRTSFYYRYWFYFTQFGNYLTERDIVLVSGEHFHLGVKNINKRLTYVSTDYKVAYANLTGRVTAYQPGLAFIHVKVDGEVLTCRVRVIKLNHTLIELKVGESKDLNVKGCWFFESYKSSNSAVAKVSTFGKVTAKAKGEAVITVKARGRTMTCKVKVIK